MNIKKYLLNKLEENGFITIEKEPVLQLNTTENKTKTNSVLSSPSESNVDKLSVPIKNGNSEFSGSLTNIVKEYAEQAHNHQEESLLLRERALTLKEKLFDLKCAKQDLITHPIFTHIKSKAQLQTFMAWHVFAVWDFMSLTKRLQQDLTCTTLPWMPNRFEYAAHLINEIVLGEESDVLPDGRFMSHFGLYLAAMKEVGANSHDIDVFIEKLTNGESLESALHHTPDFIKEFVGYTINVAKNETLYAVMGSFFYGRENVIPDMFDMLLKAWSIDENQAPMFVYYLKRHIELDSGEHGPAAEKLIEIVTEKDPQKLEQVLNCAIASVKQRIKLWDGILIKMKE